MQLTLDEMLWVISIVGFIFGFITCMLLTPSHEEYKKQITEEYKKLITEEK